MGEERDINMDPEIRFADLIDTVVCIAAQRLYAYSGLGERRLACKDSYGGE